MMAGAGHGRCNLCGATAEQTPPYRCTGCGSAPPARVARSVFQGLPIGLLDWRRALPWHPAAGPPLRWFAIAEPGAAADIAVLSLPAEDGSGQLHAVFDNLSARGVLFAMRTGDEEREPPGTLQDGLKTLSAAVAASALAVELPDPCSPARLSGWLLFRDAADCHAWRERIHQWQPAARTLLREADGTAGRPDPHDPFSPLREELAVWQAAGLPCPVWWRDDDLVADSAPLRRLAAISARYRAPVLMAVIPAQAHHSLHDVIAASECASLSFCQHGWQHVNHEPEGAPKSEFGPARPLAEALADVARGATLLAERFGSRFLPVFVPPWNTLAPELAARLPECGLQGLSQYLGQPDVPVPELTRIDTQLDPIDWAAGAGARDPAVLVARIVSILQALRAAPGQPLGLLTHHRAMVEATWQFLEQLLAVLEESPGVCWLHPAQAFTQGGAETTCAA